MKAYQIHGRVKGKHVFEETPSVRVWADNPEQAEERARHMIKEHPIMNTHFSDDVYAEPEAVSFGPLTGGGGE